MFMHIHTYVYMYIYIYMCLYIHRLSCHPAPDRTAAVIQGRPVRDMQRGPDHPEGRNLSR